MFDLQFNHDQWQLWGGMSGLLATVMVLPMIDLSQSWVVGAWLTLFIVQVAQRAWAGLRGLSIAGVYFDGRGSARGSRMVLWKGVRSNAQSCSQLGFYCA